MKTIRVSVALALPSRQEVVALELPEASTVADALEAAGIGLRIPGSPWQGAQPGLWSRECRLETPLREGDRVELYRPLQADPKAQRRARARPASKAP